jgi:hypothetical protein
MIGPKRRQRVRDRPGFERPVRVVISGQHVECRLPDFGRACLPGTIGVHCQIPCDSEQPGPGGPVSQGLGMPPGTHEGLLNEILRTLPVATRQVQGVTKQGAAVLGV